LLLGEFLKFYAKRPRGRPIKKDDARLAFEQFVGKYIAGDPFADEQFFRLAARIDQARGDRRKSLRTICDVLARDRLSPWKNIKASTLRDWLSRPSGSRVDRRKGGSGYR